MSLWIILGSLLVNVGDTLTMRWVKTRDNRLLLAACMVHVLDLIAWVMHLRTKRNLSQSASMWSALSLYVAVCVGVLVFGEKLDGRTALSIALVLIAVWIAP
jgi:multidrug transporter EmrE-like cation transporter